MSGLHFDSLADLPTNLQQQAVAKLYGEKQAVVAEKKSKYKNIKETIDGISFDSKKEARRYSYLKKAAELGLIYDLRLQHDFTLQEAYTKPNGERVRAIRYKADFTYLVNQKIRSSILNSKKLYLHFSTNDLDFWFNCTAACRIVEDTKTRGTKTKEYMIKKKLMADLGHEIREV